MNWPSRKVRDTFLQYFLRHPRFPHKHVPSSSIVPKNDPSLAFVNAGMNQFKDVILGLGRPPHPRVVNSQKCLRINDLSLVGADTYHHTFFEMLGNWSFADYFKPEACEMAWELLTEVYKLDPARMYVTYYAGGHNIPVDTETRDIWKALGVPEDRILPFGSENFWTMGPIGPCGPSTEIHYDHRGTKTETSEVNGDSGKVVEVWNLVFMQYNRSASGNIERLPLSHVVDTGAGLERLTAVLNGKVSNYDTDLFLPIFDTLSNNSSAPKYQGSFSPESSADRNYRVFADHIRAITVALSDGILPQTNHKILKLVRRSLSVSRQQFVQPTREKDLVNLLTKSVKTVTDSLSSTYSQVAQMNNQINEILQNEVEKFVEAEKHRVSKKSILPSELLIDFPRLGKITKEELSQVLDLKVVDGKTALRWYDSCGVTEEALEDLCASMGLVFKRDEFRNEASQAKLDLRHDFVNHLINDTDRQFTKKIEAALSKQDANQAGGVLQPNILNGQKYNVEILHVFTNDGELSESTVSFPDNECWVTLTQSPFIPGSLYMDSDIGLIILENGDELEVGNVLALPSGWILHKIKGTENTELAQNAKVSEFQINNERRFGREISAKALYSLQRWMNLKFGVVRYAKQFITHDQLKIELTILKGDLDQTVINQLEMDLLEDPVVVTKKSSESNGVYQLECKTGVTAETIKRHGVELKECLQKLIVLTKDSSKFDEVEAEIKSLRDMISGALSDTSLIFSLSVLTDAKEAIMTADKFVSKNQEISQTKRMTESLVSDKGQFIIRRFKSDLEFSSLKKITRVAEQKPVLVLINSSEGNIQGRCVVPKELVNKGASAQKWLQSFADELGTGVVSPPKGQNADLVCNLKRTHVEDLDERVERGISQATLYINDYCFKDVIDSSRAV